MGNEWASYLIFFLYVKQKIKIMFSKELEDLINYSISDGEIDKKEKQTIYKKALAEGVDLDELEIYLKSKIHGLSSGKEQHSNSKEQHSTSIDKKTSKTPKKINKQKEKFKSNVSSAAEGVTDAASNAVAATPYFLLNVFIRVFQVLWRIITFPFRVLFDGCLGFFILLFSVAMFLLI